MWKEALEISVLKSLLGHTPTILEYAGKKENPAKKKKLERTPMSFLLYKKKKKVENP